MSLIVLCSLESFRKKTNWPLYYYSQRLEAMGYPSGYIEAFLSKLQKEMQPGEDPDVALQRVISKLDNLDLTVDPYKYYGNNPEDIAGQWASYYKKRPSDAKSIYGDSGLNIQSLSLDEMLEESRSWGSRHAHLVDRLSDGYSMVRLDSVESIMECGDELSVCLGNNLGNQIRNEVSRGDAEVWALIDPYGQTVVMADTIINHSDNIRYLQQVRAYKNRGFRYKGYGDYIDEWLSLHPEISTEEYHMQPSEYGDDAEWEMRGGHGDDDPDDWEDDYKRERAETEDDGYEPEEELSLEDQILQDIDDLTINNMDELDDGFLISLLPKIISSSYLDDEIIVKYFNKFPNLIDYALNYPKDDYGDYSAFLSNMVYTDHDVTRDVYLAFTDNLLDKEDIITILERYEETNPEFHQRLIEYGRNLLNPVLEILPETFFDDIPLSDSLNMLACYQDEPELMTDVFYNIILDILSYLTPEKISAGDLKDQSNLRLSRKLYLIESIFNTFNVETSEPGRSERALDIFGRIMDILPSGYNVLQFSNILVYNQTLSSDLTPLFIKEKAESMSDVQKINDLLTINNVILKYNDGMGPNDDQKIEYYQNISYILKRIQDLRNNGIYNGEIDGYIANKLFSGIKNSSLEMQDRHQIVLDSYPELLLQSAYISQFLKYVILGPDHIVDYYDRISNILNSIMDFYKSNNIDPGMIFNNVDERYKKMLYWAGLIPPASDLDHDYGISPWQENPFAKAEQQRNLDQMSRESGIIIKMHKFSQRLDSVACDLSDSIDSLLIFS